MTLDVLDDFLLKDLSLEALERAFQTLTAVNLYFSQRSPRFVNSYVQGNSFRWMSQVAASWNPSIEQLKIIATLKDLM